jgi:hypothetical protein
MKKLKLKTDKLNNLDTELIGNGGQSRLDIMLDLESGEVWADEFYDHEANSWKEYDEKNIVKIGKATNAILEDDETGEADPEGRCWWNVEIFAAEKDCLNPYGNNVTVAGDYYNDNYNVDVVLDAIKNLYDPVQEMFDEYANKFGPVVWDGVELALTQDPYPDGPFDDACFRASAMDRAGNLWEVRWDILPDVDPNADYADQCDWDCPAYAEMTDEGYYREEQ